MAEPERLLVVGEGQYVGHKSVRTVTEKTADFSELAEYCIFLAAKLLGVVGILKPRERRWRWYQPGSSLGQEGEYGR